MPEKKKKPENTGNFTEIIRDEKGRFKKGTSGNPKGKPPGAFSLLSILREKLQTVPKGEQQRIAELLLERYIDKSYEENDGTAIRDMVDRIDGRPHQTVTIDNEKDAEWLEVFNKVASRIKQ